MLDLNLWGALGLGLGLVICATLCVIWWRQQSRRWPLVLVVALLVAPALSWWSGIAFTVADYRAGCDGLCPGFRGAPVSFFLGQAAGGTFQVGRFLVNSLVYLALLLGWSMVLRTVWRSLLADRGGRAWVRLALMLLLLVAPFALSPVYLPPPQAHVRGDSLRVAINARREVYLYDQDAPAAVLRTGLEDVRPRGDGQPGMRVCLALYTWFYLPAGHMRLDMGIEGVHSNGGGVAPLSASCWE
jgi:hypothetical protein